MSKTNQSTSYLRGMEYLIEASQMLSHAQSLEDIVEVTRKAARHLTGADGATFILRDQNLCFYVDEDAIAPLWKGRRFPMPSCVSGWAMLNKATAVIEDIYQDERIPIEAYKTTFVKSMAMVPIRKQEPIGAIGNYWAQPHKASEDQIRLLEALANSTAIALENIRLIADLKKLNASLESSVVARDEFITIASHELKTPLTSLLLQLQLLRRQVTPEKNQAPTPLKQAEGLDMSLRQVLSLSALVEKLLDLSEVRMGRIQLQLNTLNFSQLVHDIINRFKPELESAKCDVHLNIEDGIELNGDQLRLEQVISNLISNVLKYAPGKPVKIILKKPKHGVILFTVEDDGPGIPKDQQEKIFERFGRAISPRNVSGIGLGLYIARALAEAHGGSMYVESEAGKGAKFTVELPQG